MIKNETTRIWVNRVFAFLAGAFVLFIILQIAVISGAKRQNIELKKNLDEIQYEPGRLLDEGKIYFEKNDYKRAKEILNTLFEKHPTSKERIEGKTLYTEIEKKQEEINNKWDAAVVGIRREWAKTMAMQLREKFEKERGQMEKDMNNNLDSEWEKIKDQIREDWEKGK
jgi:uncharacterized membrane-anchored protein YhcB (DUF1043 family)